MLLAIQIEADARCGLKPLVVEEPEQVLVVPTDISAEPGNAEPVEVRAELVQESPARTTWRS